MVRPGRCNAVSALPKRPSAHPWGALLLLALALGWLGAFASAGLHLRQEALQAAHIQAQGHVRSIEHHLSFALQAVDLAAASIDASTPGVADHEVLTQNLSATLRPLPFLRSLSLLDAQGRVVASTNARNVGVMVGTAAFFPWVDAQSALLRVGAPWQGRDVVNATQSTPETGFAATDVYVLPVLRRVMFRGNPYWLLANLNPDYFVNHTLPLLAPEDGHVDWLRYDGVLLMSSDPTDASRLGLPQALLLGAMQASDAGQLDHVLADGRQVLTAYRVSSRYPAWVVVHVHRDRVLAQWASQMGRLAAVVVPVLLALLLAAGLYQRRHRLLAAQRAQIDEAHRLAASVIESSRDPVIITDRQAHIVAVNPAFERVSGYSAQEVQGRNPRLLSSGQQDRGFYAAMWQHIFEHGHWQGELVNRHKGGGLYTVQLSVHAVQGSDGELKHYAGVMVDITQRKAEHERLQVAASVFTHASDGIMITDPSGHIIDVNAAFTHITGYGRDEAIGQNARMLSAGHKDKAFYAAMWHALLTQGEWSGEVSNRRKGGEVYAELLNISAVRDAQGQVQRYVALFSDISKQKEYESKLVQIAHYDALTGLPNRVLLADRLRQAMARSVRTGRKLAALFLDLDGFKGINDNFGHEAGDRLLVALSGRLRDALREGDTLARVGGDEFVGVLVDIQDPLQCVDLLERLCAAAARAVVVDGQTLQVSASIGVSFYPQEDEVDAEQLLRQADHAMYQAKVTGKNRFHIFDEVQERDMRVRHENLEHIETGLARHEFLLYYQPKVHMRTGQVLGAEALIRWQHPSHGMLSPAQFLPALHNHPLGIEVGNWVIEQAVRQVLRWKSQGLHLPVSVNVDAQQLCQEGFLESFRTLLQRYPALAPGDLELEILETSALMDMEAVSRVIAACKEMGVLFALDDFGTGYSSLSYLRHLPAQVLKIDRSFVRDMLSDPDDLAMLDGVIGLSVAFRRDVIAEGVETVAHGEMLLRLGCEWGQGYAIAKPMPADKLAAWAATWQPNPVWRHTPRMRREDLSQLLASVERGNAASPTSP